LRNSGGLEIGQIGLQRVDGLLILFCLKLGGVGFGGGSGGSGLSLLHGLIATMQLILQSLNLLLGGSEAVFEGLNVSRGDSGLRRSRGGFLFGLGGRRVRCGLCQGASEQGHQDQGYSEQLFGWFHEGAILSL
jgi:hypothetical protein